MVLDVTRNELEKNFETIRSSSSFFPFLFFFFPPLLKCCEGLLISSVIFHISSVLLQGCTFYSACYVSKILIIDVILYIYREKNLSILSIFLCLFVL